MSGTFRTAPHAPRATCRSCGAATWPARAGASTPTSAATGSSRRSRALEPDFFLCSGDTSTPTARSRRPCRCPTARDWRNIITEEKAKVAETLDEFRGQFPYNLLDENLRAVRRRGPADRPVGRPRDPQQLVPRVRSLTDDRYTERTSTCSPRARGGRSSSSCRSRRGRATRRAASTAGSAHGPLLDVFVLDMRTYRDANADNRYADPQPRAARRAPARVAQARAARSTATWKVIANDMPLGLVVPDGAAIEAVAQGDAGAPLGPRAPVRGRARVRRTGAASGHRLPDRRRALHRGPPLRPRARRRRGLRRRSGSSSPDR